MVLDEVGLAKVVLEDSLIHFEQLLDLGDLFLKLEGHLVHLGALHVVVVDLVSPYRLIDALFLVLQDQVVVSCMAGHKLVYHKLLKSHDVKNVELLLQVV